MATYSAVPPPGHVEETTLAVTAAVSVAGEDKPRHVHDHQWKKFCELKLRRERELSTGTARRIEATRNKALCSISKQLSEPDREALEEEGVSLPHVRKRKRERGKKKDEHEKGKGCEGSAELAWKEVRGFMDPNPQLKAVELGKDAPKTLLEEEMDECIERGEIREAVEMSDKLSQREFAEKVTTAFNCRDYVERKRIEDERRRKRKPPKLKWKFEPKQPWEMKGNM